MAGDEIELSPALADLAALLAVLRGCGVARYRFGGLDIRLHPEAQDEADAAVSAIGFDATSEPGFDTDDDVSPEAQRDIDAALRRRRSQRGRRAAIGPGRVQAQEVETEDNEEPSAYHNRNLWGAGGPPRFPGVDRK